MSLFPFLTHLGINDIAFSDCDRLTLWETNSDELLIMDILILLVLKSARYTGFPPPGVFRADIPVMGADYRGLTKFNGTKIHIQNL